MQVAGINGSGRAGGNTAVLVEAIPTRTITCWIGWLSG